MLYALYKRPTEQLRKSDNIFDIAIFRQTALAAHIDWTVLAQELFFFFSFCNLLRALPVRPIDWIGTFFLELTLGLCFRIYEKLLDHAIAE